MRSTSTIALIATGDLMFYGPLASRMRESGDPLWGFSQVATALRNCDVLFGNFETPVTLKRERQPDAPDLYFSPPGTGLTLKRAGYSVVNIAHNHIYDFGPEGVETTFAELRTAGLPYIGIGTTPEEAAVPAIVRTPDGAKVGFLGYTTMCNALDRKHSYVGCFPEISRVVEDVRRLRMCVDAVVVSCHTGAHKNPYPAPEARDLAHSCIEAGAAVYLGHHPHISQGIERFNNGVAVYSLGDFVTPVHDDETRRTFFVKIWINDGSVADYEYIPCYINDDCQVTIAEGELKQEIAANIDLLTDSIATGRSDELHYEFARRRFVSHYLRTWADELKTGGLRVFARKLRHIRPYHLRLMWHTFARLARSA